MQGDSAHERVVKFEVLVYERVAKNRLGKDSKNWAEIMWFWFWNILKNVNLFYKKQGAF